MHSQSAAAPSCPIVQLLKPVYVYLMNESYLRCCVCAITVLALHVKCVYICLSFWD